MLKHAGERPQQHKQGFVQPVVCSLSLAALFTSCKNSFSERKKEQRDLTPLLCCTPTLLHKEIVLQRLFLNTSSREQFVRLRSEKLKMQRTCCSLYTRAARWAAAAYDCMPMCIGSFSYTRSRLASLARLLFVGQSDVRRTWPTEWELKGIVHPKIFFLALIIYPHVVWKIIYPHVMFAEIYTLKKNCSKQYQKRVPFRELELRWRMLRERPCVPTLWYACAIRLHRQRWRCDQEL